MIISSHYTVNKLPRRGKEEAWPGVSGHAWVDLGDDLYEITQDGLADLRPSPGGRNSNALAKIQFMDRPGVFDGSDPVSVDTLGQGVYDHCRLVDVRLTRVSPNVVKYHYRWRQMSPGHSLTWPY